jgi:hypothetical protein
VWPFGVVLDPPGFNCGAGVGQADEPVFVQTLATAFPLKLSMYAFSFGLPPTATAVEPVGHEVHGPVRDRRGRLRLRQRLALEYADPFALVPPNGQASPVIEAIDALAIDLPTFATQTQIHPSIDIAPLDRGNLLDASARPLTLRPPAPSIAQ